MGDEAASEVNCFDQDAPGAERADWLRGHGVIAEVNRRLLHPRGLALFIDIDSGELHVFFDADPEGWSFAADHLDMIVAEDLAGRFDALVRPEREAALGYVVQPLPED